MRIIAIIDVKLIAFPILNMSESYFKVIVLVPFGKSMRLNLLGASCI